jgi:hypothetical protein
MCSNVERLKHVGRHGKRMDGDGVQALGFLLDVGDMIVGQRFQETLEFGQWQVGQFLKGGVLRDEG